MKEHTKEKIKRWAQRTDEFFVAHSFAFLAIFSVALCIVIECLCRRSAFGGFVYIFTSPLLFVFNSLIILLTLSPSLLIKRRYFYIAVLLATWLGLGIANCVVLGYRITPIGFIDIILMESVWSIIHVYLTVWQIILIAVAIIAALAGCVVIWKKLPRHKVRYPRAAITVVCVVVATLALNFVGASASVLPDDFGNLAMDYEKYGFAYCFSRSVVDRGIDESKDYSDSSIDELLASLPKDNEIPTEKPNVIFLQLESFFDVNKMKNLTYSENPIPNFTRLREQYAHGALYVPSLGAGTANTEFEILTGMSVSHFGAGEYPYKTVLKDTAAESMAYNFSSLGYSSHAIHNHEGSFYDRNEIYAKLGFDTYTSVEYMQNVERNPLGWAKDTVLTENIFKALSSTDGSDFIFAVSVQAHGKYPREELGISQKIELSGIEDEKIATAFEYYVNQIYEEDYFIGQLTSRLAAFDEKTVLVIYGDHLPAFEIDDTDLTCGDVFRTEYIIWSNYELMPRQEKNLQANELSAYVMEKLGYNAGVFTKFHQSYRERDDYDEKLELLAYDALYGDRHIYGGERLVPTDMRMGIDEISVTDAKNVGESAYISGKNFNPSSIVYINGKKKNTHFVDKSTLYLPSSQLDESDVITVAQAGEDGIVLSFCREYIFGE